MAAALLTACRVHAEDPGGACARVPLAASHRRSIPCRATPQVGNRLKERGFEDNQMMYRVSCYTAKVGGTGGAQQAQQGAPSSRPQTRSPAPALHQPALPPPLSPHPHARQVTLECLHEMFQSAKHTMHWLSECARLIAKEGHSVMWHTPLGLPVVQPYRRKDRQHVRTLLQARAVWGERGCFGHTACSGGSGRLIECRA